jgi:hypothetical protein
MTLYNRAFAVSIKNTFSIEPLKDFVEHYLSTNLVKKPIIIDPFVGSSKYGTLTNDIDKNVDAMYNLDAEVFLDMLLEDGVKADVVLYDPPSNVKQCGFYTGVKDRIRPLVKPDGLVLSFGGSSMGVGKKFGDYEEILLVTHGGVVNDTICVAQRKDTIYV